MACRLSLRSVDRNRWTRSASQSRQLDGPTFVVSRADHRVCRQQLADRAAASKLGTECVDQLCREHCAQYPAGERVSVKGARKRIGPVCVGHRKLLQ